jgi:hypothetical protein
VQPNGRDARTFDRGGPSPQVCLGSGPLLMVDIAGECVDAAHASGRAREKSPARRAPAT